MSARGWVGAVLVPLLCACGTGASQPREATAGIPAGAQRAVVVRVVDGDTLWVRATGAGALPVGRPSKVRLLEYDTPERGECWFDEASAALSRLAAPGSTVWLTSDREETDRYGRALRYAWNVDGVFIDVTLVRSGAGRALLVRPNDAHIAEIRAAEAEARRDRRGLWGSCGG